MNPPDSQEFSASNLPTTAPATSRTEKHSSQLRPVLSSLQHTAIGILRHRYLPIYLGAVSCLGIAVFCLFCLLGNQIFELGFRFVDHVEDSPSAIAEIVVARIYAVSMIACVSIVAGIYLLSRIRSIQDQQ